MGTQKLRTRGTHRRFRIATLYITGQQRYITRTAALHHTDCNAISHRLQRYITGSLTGGNATTSQAIHLRWPNVMISWITHLPAYNCRCRRLLWVYCLGHAGVKGNDRADTMAGKATLASGLLLGRSEVLRKSTRHYLRAQSRGRHTTNRPEERGVERGSARRCSLKGRDRAIVSQTNIGTVSKAMLEKLSKDGVERIWALLSTYHLELN